MIAYTLKTILETLPEASQFIKSASVEQDYPLDNADSCIASALAANYAQNYEYSPIQAKTLEKIATAVKLYKVEDTVNDLIEKFAAAKLQEKEDQIDILDFISKQASFGETLSSSETPLSAHLEAQLLAKEASHYGVETTDKVNLYTGQAYLCKMAAVQGLAVRYHKTGNTDYVKIASALAQADEFSVKPETLMDLCSTVAVMDKKAEERDYSMRGLDFFQEALTTKQASFEKGLKVKLAGKEVAYSDVKKIGKDRLSSYLGKEACDGLTGTAKNDIKFMEGMSRDHHNVILKMMKST